jgi:cob(I)alamin adenosyltransferase
MEQSMAQGLIVVYTGNGPGNYSSSLGLAFRALGRGLRVCVMEFAKRKEDKGLFALGNPFNGRFEYLSADVEAGNGSDPEERQRQKAIRALQTATKAIQSGRFEMVVLHRLGDLVAIGLVSTREVLELLTCRPPNLHLVISGPSVPDQVCKVADLVTRVEHTESQSPRVTERGMSHNVDVVGGN